MYVFRAKKEEDPDPTQNGFQAADVNSTQGLQYHIKYGSKPFKKPTRFVSTSKNIRAMNKYTVGEKGDNKTRSKVYLIDLPDDNSIPYYDFTDENTIKKYLTIKDTRNWVKADSEVTVEPRL